MAKEIERKFLVKDRSYRLIGKPEYYKQGYLSLNKECTVRVRIVGDKGYITIKGIVHSLTRDEYEYEIPKTEADEMLNNLCVEPLIEKYRYKVPYAENGWEVDEFLGDNEGLIVAEIELPDEDAKVTLPTWIGEEVTDDRRFFNSLLVKNPFQEWPDKNRFEIK